jgi:hypothetical protein
VGSQAQYWSTTPGSNQSVDPDIFSADSQSPSTVDDNVRSVMAAVAKYRKDTDGALTASGTANALTATTNQVLISGQLTGGLGILVKAVNANTTVAVTFAPDGLTAQPIKRADGSALAIGSIQPNMLLDLAYAAATSEWWAKNISPAGVGITGVTDGSSAGPGQVGEFMSAVGATGGPASAAPTNMVSLNLPAGDWDVGGLLTLMSGGPVTALQASISTVSSTHGGWTAAINMTSATIAVTTSLTVPQVQVLTGASLSTYLVGQQNFVSGSPQIRGIIWARRAR